MKNSLVVPVEHLTAGPYASVLCFPKPSETEMQSRLRELASLGVTALEFSGKAILFGVEFPVLGKGYVGIVVAAHRNGNKVALKIRRTDANRADLLREAQMLSIANSVCVGPKLVEASKNFLLMQLIEGDPLSVWLGTATSKESVRKVLLDVLEQCRRLDEAGLDHGELSRAPKHVLVDRTEKPFIVDFETSSVQRRVANVTAICQYLFAGTSPVSKAISEIFAPKDKERIVEALRIYKRSKTEENFQALLRACSL